MDKKAFRSINYGLYIVSSGNGEGGYAGCVANTFQQIASEPPLVSVALNKENHTTSCIQKTKRFGVSVLSEEATMELVGKFGFHSSKDTDKFSDVEFDVDENGVPAVTECASALFHVKVTNIVDAATHLLFIGEVEEAEVVSDVKTMTYDYYHSVLRGKTPPKASSYNGGESDGDSGAGSSGAKESKLEEATSPQEDQGPKRIGWRCTLCGYVVEMDELPEDFTCPICGVGPEFFERIEIE